MEGIFSLSAKVVILTGGAGHLGRAMAQGLLDFGATVVVADIAETRADQIATRGIERLSLAACDVSRTESIQALMRSTKERHGGIDVLINCAYYGAGYGKDLQHMTDEVWSVGVDGAVGTVFRCTREAVPYLEASSGGAVVNIASMYGMVSPDPRIYGSSGQDNPANYGAGKAAVLQLTRWYASHLAPKGIRVNSISPGAFPDTRKGIDAEFLQRLEGKTMLGRIGKPRDLVGAVVFLASDASSYMTGANIVVDGGWTAW